MSHTGIQDRNGKLGEYHQLLRRLASELDRSMQAIAQNTVSVLEESVINQQVLSARLSEIAESLGSLPDLDRSAASPVSDHRPDDQRLADQRLIRDIRAASATLQTLNRRYSALLKYSSRSVALMVSLFGSYQGRFQEGSGTGLERHTWSCQI